MNKQSTVIESLDAQGRGVRVEFFRAGDRYAHRLLAVDGDASVVALASLAAAEDDFSAPTYQDLNIQSVADRSFAALVGMSGSSHWSLTVEPAVEIAQPGLVFDAAVRMKAALPHVTNAYQLVAGVEIGDRETAHKIVTPAGKLLLQTLAVDAQQDAASPVEISDHEPQLLIRREIAPPDALPATVRWRYEVILLS